MVSALRHKLSAGTLNQVYGLGRVPAFGGLRLYIIPKSGPLGGGRREEDSSRRQNQIKTNIPSGPGGARSHTGLCDLRLPVLAFLTAGMGQEEEGSDPWKLQGRPGLFLASAGGGGGGGWLPCPLLLLADPWAAGPGVAGRAFLVPIRGQLHLSPRPVLYSPSWEGVSGAVWKGSCFCISSAGKTGLSKAGHESAGLMKSG